MDKEPPDVIYLQWYDEDGQVRDVKDRTYCEDKINDNDVEYRRVDQRVKG